VERPLRRGDPGIGGLRVKIHATPLSGLMVIEAEPRCDDRGSFARTYCPMEFQQLGLDFSLCQINVSNTLRAGAVRGLHFQRAPKAEAKVVQCMAGEIFDVAVDLRPESPTYCRWHGLHLRAGDWNMFFLPEGFAHGFQTLVDDSAVQYFMGEFFDPQCQAGVRFNDPAFGIQWPLPMTSISQRDMEYPDYRP
jgi:dTDP-4-dehydrorhamnose 3,5-epimerase